jgi:hypothetical protein
MLKDRQKIQEMIGQIVKEQLTQLHLNEEVNAGIFPVDLQSKTKSITDSYIKGLARWYSLENLFFELIPFVNDPMEAVSYIYNELYLASQDDFSSGVNSGRLKQKAQDAYSKLVILANQARIDLNKEDE